MKNQNVSIDTQSVTSGLANIKISTNMDASFYSAEWLTWEYIEIIFDAISNLQSEWDYGIITGVNAYIEETEIISNTLPEPPLPYKYEGTGVKNKTEGKNVVILDGTSNSLEDNYYSGTVNIKNGHLNVRSGEGINTKIIGTLEKNEKLKIINTGENSGWAKIELNDGNVGYVSREYLTNIKKEGRSSNNVNNLGNMVDTKSEKIPLHNIKASVRTEGSNLNVRSGAGTNYGIIGSYKTGDNVTVLEKGDKWTKVLLEDGTEAFVASKYLKFD